MQTSLLKLQRFFIAETPWYSGPTGLPERKWPEQRGTRRGLAQDESRN